MKRKIPALIFLFFSSLGYGKEFNYNNQPDSNIYNRDGYEQVFDKGIELLEDEKFKEAITQSFDPIISYYENSIKEEGVKLYASRSSKETLHYLITLAKNNISQNAKVIPNIWSQSYFYRGFASLELNEISNAKQYINKAIDLSPVNSNYLYEMGYINQLEKNWNECLEFFNQAEKFAIEYSPEEVQKEELSRAMRGIGYCLIELGRLDEAEKKFAEALQKNPLDKKSSDELEYIKKLRKMHINIEYSLPR